MANQYTAFRYIDDTHKECSFCSLIKEHKDFHKDKKNIRTRGLAYYCKECANTKARQHHSARSSTIEYKEAKKSAHFLFTYGISLSEYREKLEKQRTCSICDIVLVEGEAHLDHCHSTGRLRDFLCGNCNRGIGSFHDQTWKLKRAIQYLQSHNPNDCLDKEVSNQ